MIPKWIRLWLIDNVVDEEFAQIRDEQTAPIIKLREQKDQLTKAYEQAKEQASRRELNEAEIESALSMIEDHNPQWLAILQIIENYRRDELDPLLRAGASSEDRHYNAGRNAMLEELRTALVEKRRQSRYIST